MRNLFFILLIINALFLLWQYQQPEQVEIPLKKEFGDLRIIKDPSILQDSDQAYLCHRFGPFNNQIIASQFLDEINTLRFSADITTTSFNRVRDYWVVDKRLKTLDARQNDIRRLKKNGLSDVSIITSTPDKHMLSLGVFNFEDNAKQRLRQAHQLKILAEIVERGTKIQLYWVDVQNKTKQKLNQQRLRDLQKKYKSLGVKQVKCE